MSQLGLLLVTYGRAVRLRNRTDKLQTHHPQTNGKIERFFRSVEDEICHYESMSAYIEYYNENRLHFALDMTTTRRR